MNTTNTTYFDVLIIGGGPIGLACGIEAQKAGLSYLILEKGNFINSLYRYPVTMTFFSTSLKLEIGEIPFVSNNPRPSRNEALEYYRRVAQHYRLNFHLFEEVTAIRKEENHFEVKTIHMGYTSKKVIVATGFYGLPFLLNIPGEQLPKVTHYYKDPAFYAFQKVVVIGASNSAVDAALETWRKGADVTMIIRGSGIGERVKYWIKPDVENRIKEGSIKAFYHSTVNEIKPHSIIFKTPEGVKEIENDFVIAATGYQPDLEFLKRSGIQLQQNSDRTPIYNEESNETNIPGLYLAGVICGGMNTHSLFIENSRAHAIKIFKHITGTRSEYAETANNHYRPN